MKAPFWFALLLSLLTEPVLGEEDAMETARQFLEKNGLSALVTLQTQRLQENLPIESSKFEKIVGVAYLSAEKVQTYRHLTAPNWRSLASQLTSLPVNEIDHHLPTALQQQTVNAACSVPLTKLLLEHGLKITHTYYEADGSFLFSTSVRLNDCANNKSDKQ